VASSGSKHGPNNYKDNKPSSLLVFNRVYRLEKQSVMLVFSPLSFVNCCPSNLLSSSTLPPPPFPMWISGLYTRIQCVRGGYGIIGLRQINTCRKVPLQVNFFRWRHFAFPSVSLIFLLSQYTVYTRANYKLNIVWNNILKLKNIKSWKTSFICWNLIFLEKLYLIAEKIRLTIFS
jgi:hypothetical protein